MEIYVTYNSDNQIEKLKDRESSSLSFNFINSNSIKGKKKARELKAHWGARLDPFSIIFDGVRPIKAFYSETGEDIIESLIKYIQSYENTSDR